MHFVTKNLTSGGRDINVASYKELSEIFNNNEELLISRLQRMGSRDF